MFSDLGWCAFFWCWFLFAPKVGLVGGVVVAGGWCLCWVVGGVLPDVLHRRLVCF